MIKEKIILASSSPRRIELIKKIAANVVVSPSPIEEKIDFSLKPIYAAQKAAAQKAQSVSGRIVVGADTLVVLDGQILLKPKDKACAKKMLGELSGKTHSVITGVCVIKDGQESLGFCRSYVTFNVLTDKQIENYVASGKPLDKAGAYGIQDGYGLVKSYRGSFCNIVGLPIKLVARLIKE